MSPSRAVDLLAQRQFGHYEILERLGSGSMGEVYKAKDLTLGRLLAIKVLREPLASDPTRLARFEQEARWASALNHPNIVTIYEIGKVEDRPYIAMELVDGRTLREIIAGGPLLTRRALQLAVQAADGLAQAHAAGIVHRDLKPGNVIVTEDGRLKLLDFGLAKLIPPPVSENAATGSLDSPGTEPGAILGTVGYMSPEQARGLAVDFRSDQFSCGAILYELATGKPAFRRASAVQTLAAIIEVEPEPIASLNPEVPPPLRWIIERCLAKEPAQRYASTRDLARDLTNVLEHLTEVSTGAPPLAPGELAAAVGALRTRRYVIAAVGIVGCVAGVALWMIASRGVHNALPSPPTTLAAPVKARRSVAVLGFRSLSARPEAAWLSTALSEMLTTELAAGGKLRTIPGEAVGRMKLELSLSDAESLAADTLARVGRNLGTDLVLLGSYLRQADGHIRVDLRLQETSRGETITTLAENGSEAGLVALVTQTGSDLRRLLSVDEPSTSEATGSNAGIPATLEAQRHYAEGLARLRVLDALAAKDRLAKAAAADPNAPMVHAALAEAWSRLGYDARAKDEARKAFDLAGKLSREEQLSVEGRYRETAAEWDRAIEIYRSLFTFLSDDIEYGLGLARALSHGGKGEEALATLDSLKRLPSRIASDPRIDMTEAEVSQSLGDFRREQAAASRAASRGAAQGARLVVARARVFEAYALRQVGEHAKATAAGEEARRIYADAGDRGGVAWALKQTADVLFWGRGDLDGAKKLYQEALVIFREIGNKGGAAETLSKVAAVLVFQGEIGKATRLWEEALTIDREISSARDAAINLDNLAEAAYDQGQLTKSKSLYEEALAICRAIGEKSLLADVNLGFGRILLASGDVAGASKQYETAMLASGASGAKRFSALALFSLAELLLTQDDLAGARHRHEEALALRNELGDKFLGAESHVALATVTLEEGRSAAAEDLARVAAVVFAQQRAAHKEALAQVVLARALLRQGKLAEAEASIGRANTLSTRTENVHVRLAVATASATVLAAGGRPSEAAKALEAALAQATTLGLVGAQLEARLALGEIGRLPRGGLAAVEADAKAKSFGLIARRTAAAMRRTER